MSEPLASLRDHVETALNEWMAANGGGYCQGFVIGADFIDAEGRPTLAISSPTTQPTHKSLGLIQYMTIWFDRDANDEIDCAVGQCSHDEDEG